MFRGQALPDLFSYGGKMKNKPKELIVYFGIPGSGKTTIAALFAKRELKKGRTVYSNVPILGCKKLDPKDLGTVLVEDGLVILDEAGIEFNSRKYKDLPQSCIQFAKLFRHYNCNIAMFSQDYEDMDITFRRLASKFVIVRKSYIPYFIFTRDLQKYIGLDENGQIISKYRFRFMGFHWYFMPAAWKLFDSYESPYLPSKEWEIYDYKSRYEKHIVAEGDS